MAEVIRMPKMSDTMTEGVVVKWNIKVGDNVKSGDVLAEVETDKATMDFECYNKGQVLYLAVKEGESIPVDGIAVIVGQPGEDYTSLLQNAPSSSSAVIESAAKDVVAVTTAPVVEKTAQQVTAVADSDDRVKASPLAKKLAQDKGINISAVAGSGENGRIVKRDVENYDSKSAAGPVLSSAGVESFDEIPVSQMRKTIAARLSESKFSAPHFYLTMEINMDKALAARESLNSYSESKISVNDLIIKACSLALIKHPKVNSSWLDTKIRINHHVNIGVAMAVDEGLLVPVVRFANTKSLSAISSEVKEYSQKAKDKKLQPQDWAGNTFTISNLGMFGIEEFTAIINPPDACILAVGSVKDVVGVFNGEMRPAKIMKLTLSCDHRVVDGVVGSKFLNTLKELLEEPVKMLV